MASVYRIHKPYVLATLPRPLDHTGGSIVAREVYGQRDGVRKRRTELAVGIDGEAASIYDVRYLCVQMLLDHALILSRFPDRDLSPLILFRPRNPSPAPLTR